MDPGGNPLAAILGRLAGDSKPSSARNSGPARRGERKNDRVAAGNSIRGRSGTRGTLGHLCSLRTGPDRGSMTRAHLEHIIRAAGMIADVDDLVVIGSQAVLGEFSDA